MNLVDSQEYNSLFDAISSTYAIGKKKAFKVVNSIMVETYWQIGEHIVEFEQNGKSKAIYGDKLLERLSRDLSFSFGKGFSLSNIYRFKQFYQCYPILATVSQELSWSHYCELLTINSSLERNFYEKQSIIESWSIRELKRQKNTSLFLRLAAGKDKKDILHLAQKGKIVEKPEDILKDTYVFEFLKIPEPYHISETELETRLINQLQDFLLELGKGFAFIGRQYRITLANRHHYIDLVFYHRILKCFVLIDLKKEVAGYEAIGQMNMYLGYMEAEQNVEGDNPPIGIILAREKDELQIKYAMSNTNSQLFVQKYQLYLPNEDELRKEIELIYQQNKNSSN
ncbi:MAG: PDDEXK nuclease domain-containing protein [Ideonella sp.]|nr:PDDEXK nuclease domain-containing protein [Ideonella sp.]